MTRVYHTSPADLEKIGRAYTPKIVNEEQTERLGFLAQTLSAAAASMTLMCPPGRELSLALTKMEEALHWGSEAIAREPQ